MKKLILIISLLNFTFAFSQEFSFVKLPFELTNQLYYGKILSNSTYNKDSLHCYYAFTNSGIYYSKSFDGGKNWSAPEYYGFWNQFDVLHTNDNDRIICYISLGSLKIKTFESTGNTFNSDLQIGNGSTNLQIRKLGNETGVFYSRLNRIYASISSDLINWSLPSATIYQDVKVFQILKLKNDKYFLAFTKPNEQNLYYTFSDDMINWQVPKTLLTGIPDSTRFVAEQNDVGVIALALEKYFNTPFPEFKQKDILITTSVDFGNTWSQFTAITKYKGDDNLLSISAVRNDFILSFSSKREKEFPDYYFGFLPNASDKFTPPFIYEVKPETENLTDEIKSLRFFAKTDDDELLKYAKLKLKINNEAPFEIFMNDRGVDGDELQFDKIYTGTLNRKFQKGDAISYQVLTEDISGNKSQCTTKIIFIPIDYTMPIYSMTNNRYKLSFNNEGIIANAGSNLGYLDEIRILFSSGFLLTGLDNGNLFANAVFSSSRILDYLPGIVGGTREDPKNQIYIIKADDPPFGESWQLYKYATLLNAPFYDGDFDGIYNPVDKNKNGLWDEDEDAPEILGDVTTWCVFNDAVPYYLRRDLTNPVGIEIQQSIFSFDKNENNQPDEKIFIRYRIFNRGTVNEILDSVLFSFVVDFDIGNEYQDDYFGTDTTLNLGYSYSRSDFQTGLNPPASGLSLLQGPPIYIPGITFIDNNNNGKFDNYIDTALDTAFFKYGSFIPAKKYPGAKNSEIFSSFALPQHYSFDFPIHFRLNQKGLLNDGNFINVCNNNFGTVFGNYDCSEINPIYHFSGNPIIPDGWIMTQPTDVRFLLTTGFFQLKKDEPVDIWGVYVAGRGVDSLDSITEMKKNTQSAIQFYKNFPVNEDRTPPIVILPTQYRLYQNFPNPFNNGTRIRFDIPATEFVKLKVYDITGREVATLLNEMRSAGEYEVILKSDNLSSGVYFYQITAGNFISTKKCVVIK